MAAFGFRHHSLGGGSAGRRRLLEDRRQSEAEGAADRIDGRAGCGAQQGAAAVLLASPEYAAKHGLKARAKVVKALEKASGARVFPISAPLGEGMEPLLDAAIELLGDAASEDGEIEVDERQRDAVRERGVAGDRRAAVLLGGLLICKAWPSARGAPKAGMEPAKVRERLATLYMDTPLDEILAALPDRPASASWLDGSSPSVM